MKVSESFLKAKKDKGLKSFLVILKESGEKVIRLIVEEKSKFIEGQNNQVVIEQPTYMRIENYSNGEQYGNRVVNSICFYESIWGNDSHIKTFLNAINKNSEVMFKVVAFNGCDTWKQANLVSHSLYGIIDGKTYFLSQYVGKDNTASPVQ